MYRSSKCGSSNNSKKTSSQANYHGKGDDIKKNATIAEGLSSKNLLETDTSCTSKSQRDW